MSQPLDMSLLAPAQNAERSQEQTVKKRRTEIQDLMLLDEDMIDRSVTLHKSTIEQVVR